MTTMVKDRPTSGGGTGTGDGKCPRCGAIPPSHKDNYCRQCGFKLKK